MLRLIAAAALLGLMAFAQPVAAVPPANAKPLSEIIKMLEDGGDVAYFREIEWDDDGHWEIEYVRPDGARVEVRFDPVSGQRKR